MSHDKEAIFAQRLANIILADSRIKVRNHNHILACCDLKTKRMLFNFDKIFLSGDKASFSQKVQELMTFKGLAFHEIMHLRFTAKCKTIDMTKFERCIISALEEGRIETLGIYLYNKIADYFTYSANNVLLKDAKELFDTNGNQIIQSYLWCYGRKIYFPHMELIAQMRKVIIETYSVATADKLEEASDEYLLARTFKERRAIAIKLAKYLEDRNQMPNDFGESNLSDENIADTSSDSEVGEGADMDELVDIDSLKIIISKKNQKIRDMAKGAKSNQKKRDEFNAKKSENIDKLVKDRNKLLEKMYNEQNAEKEKEIRGKLNTVNRQLNEANQSQMQPSRGAGKGINDLINEALKRIKDEQEELVEKNTADISQDMRSIDMDYRKLNADRSFNVTESMTSASKSLERALKILSNDLVSGYQNHNKAGRLNVKSYINRKNVADVSVFNKWLPSRIQNTRLLVNIFVDGSGSMGYCMNDMYEGGKAVTNWVKAVRTCWVINDALSKDNNKVMIYQFDSEYAVMKKYDEPFIVSSMLGGGTNPEGAMGNALPIIKNYARANKFRNVINVVITDGDFDSRFSVKQQFEKMNALNHETIVIRIGAGKKYNVVIDHKEVSAKHGLVFTSFNELTAQLSKIFVTIKRCVTESTRVN